MVHRLDVFYMEKNGEQKLLGSVCCLEEALILIRSQARETPGTFIVYSPDRQSRTYVEVCESGVKSIRGCVELFADADDGGVIQVTASSSLER